MKFSFVEEFAPKYIPYNLGKEIGYGKDGIVHELTGENSVIKYSFAKDSLINVFEYLIENEPKHIVRVFNYKFHNTICITKMERLIKTNEEERKVFHSILSHEDANKEKNFSDEKLNKILSGLSCGFEFNQDKIKIFCQQIKKSRIIHTDIHPRNIMKDYLGNFKLIDLDDCDVKK